VTSGSVAPVNAEPTSTTRDGPSVRGKAPRRLRVCIVAPSLDILGGQAVVAQRLMARLESDPDLDITFVPHNPRLPGPLRLLQRVKYLRTIATSIAYTALLLRRLRDQDVVHVFSASYWSFILAPTPAVLIARLFGKRVILNYRSGEALDHLSNWPRTSLPILRRADLIVVPSGYLVDVFARFGIPARPIFNFVDVERIAYRRRAHLRPVFLANRNFVAHYNVACVLRAFALIQARVPDARLIVAGDGPERERLHALAKELRLANIEFLGQVPPKRMSALYDEADIYLNAPNIDNMPNSIVEAFVAGIPVVTTRAGGIPYIVRDDENGLLTDCDDPSALAAAALRLLSDADLAARLSDRARAEALSRYTWASVHDAWRSAYGLSRGAEEHLAARVE
jgi:glycosyltransferase involved in cell wall biosynthesis